MAGNKHRLSNRCLTAATLACLVLPCFQLTALAQNASADPRVLPFDPAQNSAELDEILLESKETEGALLVTPNEIIARAPYLKALLRVDQTLSPYQLDARDERRINLKQALEIALTNNLDIKLRNTSTQQSRWAYMGALSGFLPTLAYGFDYRLLYGTYASPFGLLGHTNSTNMVMPVTASINLFDGGSMIFNALQNKHQYKASQHALRGATNDVLSQAAQLYYNLLEQDVLLQVRIKAVQTARALLARAQDRYANGANTKLDVLQAKSYLSRMRQALISQQVNRREAAVKLATALSMDPVSDLTPQDRIIGKTELIDERLPIAELVQMAVDNRPELKQYEELRLAAKNQFKKAMAQFSPQVVGNVGSITTGARAKNFGAGIDIGGPALESVGTAAAGPDGLGGGKKFRLGEIFQVGLSLNWTLGGLGTTQLAAANAAKWESRRAQLEFSKELTRIWEEVRLAYLNVLSAKNMIVETTDIVNAAAEQVEVANTRLTEGVGSDLEAINAQREYTAALIDKASAITKYNSAQAALLRAVGKTSITTMTAQTPLTRPI